MCTKKDIDDVFEQLQSCQDTEQMRRFLKETIPCIECSEAKISDGEQEYCCSCRLHFRTEIQNTIYSIQTEPK